MCLSRCFLGLHCLILYCFACQILLVTQDLNDTLILGDHCLDLRDVLETELLQLLYILPIFIQDKQIVRQIHTGLHSVLKDKFGDNFPY